MVAKVAELRYSKHSNFPNLQPMQIGDHTIQKAVNQPFPGARLNPQLIVGFTDARVYRNLGSIAYGAGLFSPDLKSSDFMSRFHGHNERIDVESLSLTTQFWIDVCHDFLS